MKLKLYSIMAAAAFLLYCPSKKDDSSKKNALLGAAFVLSQQYEATVTVVGFLQETGGAPIRDGKVKIADSTDSSYLTSGQGTIDEFTKCETDNVSALTDVTTTKLDGQFTVTFKVKSASGKVVFSAVRSDTGSSTTACSAIANFTSTQYTKNVGTANFAITVKNSKETNQLTVSDASGLKLTIKSVETVVKGSYNLSSPTTGENICDGKNVTGTPETISGDISSNKTISGSAILSGTVFVKSGATLTVDAGSVIFGNRGSSLYILQGGKLVTKGTKTAPVCFTSSQTPGSRYPGDWGGIVMIGNAIGTRSSTTEGTTPQNYGSGTDDTDSSGSLEYTIVEFAGNEVAPGDELNSFSLYTIGSGTKMQYLQAHRGLDDSFELWGGKVTGKYWLATGGLDDDFDFDEGFQGNLQYLIGHKYPTSCGGSPSTDPHGFEMDGINSGSGQSVCDSPKRCSNPTISDYTVLGQQVSGGRAQRHREGLLGSFTNGVTYNFATGITCQADAGFPTTLSAFTNIKADKSASNSGGSACDFTNVSVSLTSLPVTTEGNVATDCGFGSTKPDYTSTVSGAGGGTSATGKWWADWTVYRAR
ncbi:MAG TPA: hypothetical protein PK453_13690 [Leptospiraceae bacterium]|nr:hypothetical protein [Leptospiraceae bacterium]HNF14717.1 hypothetical protein [Leptospiraceae bacterium]HNI96462.1 hypothetical protein [Leptospiraceae bacterium]HNM02367.1 hypothetical protein [Leptospiraceae bacterium]